MIKVSVIMPVYNVENYLEECLFSVVNQSLHEIEIICVNDGSTDGSLRILQRFAAVDKRIKIISKENTGYGHSVNLGIDKAHGQYISIVETDDYIDEKMLEVLYNVASQHDLDIIKSDSRIFISQNKKYEYNYRTVLPIPKHDLYHKVTNYQKDFRVFEGYVYTWAGIYKREFLNKNHIRHHESPGASYQDNGFWFQTTMFAKKIYFLDKAFYNLRRDNPNSSIHSKEKVFCICDEYDFIREKVLESGLPFQKKLLCQVFYNRLTNYLGTLHRIDICYRQSFFERMKKDFIDALQKGEIDAEKLTRERWAYIHTVITEPEVCMIEYDRLTKHAQKCLCQADCIVIFGAGKWAKIVFEHLHMLAFSEKVSCFLVTEKEENPSTLCGIPVYSLKEYLPSEKALIILGISERYKNEVHAKLISLGKNNILDKWELSI